MLPVGLSRLSRGQTVSTAGRRRCARVAGQRCNSRRRTVRAASCAALPVFAIVLPSRVPACRAAVQFEKRDYEGCIADCKRAVERGRELRADYKLVGRALTRQGTALVRLERLEEAVQVYQKALTEHRHGSCIPHSCRTPIEQPVPCKGVTGRGTALVRLQRLEEAVRVYYKALPEHRCVNPAPCTGLHSPCSAGQVHSCAGALRSWAWPCGERHPKGPIEAQVQPLNLMYIPTSWIRRCRPSNMPSLSNACCILQHRSV